MTTTYDVWAFAGSASEKKTNIDSLLDNNVPDEAGFILPVKIPPAQRGLSHVANWVNEAYGEDNQDGFETETVANLVPRLIRERDEGSNPVLVLLWGDDGDDEQRGLLTKAKAAGLPVLDLSAGLDDLEFEPEAETPPAEPEPASRRRRRGSASKDTPETSEAVTEPSEAKADEPVAEDETPRRRGRPRGSTNKPKEAEGNAPETKVADPIVIPEDKFNSGHVREIVREEVRAALEDVFKVTLLP